MKKKMTALELLWSECSILDLRVLNIGQLLQHGILTHTIFIHNLDLFNKVK